MAAAGVILIVALVQESHRPRVPRHADRPPGRRALDERLRSLDGSYVIAMVDVDHFKQFNDTHGHDIGDQVLKLVGARLAEVGGGGIAFRYGGEEFSVVFPDAELEDVLLQLEAIRVSIEGYRMAVRAPDRPKDVEDGAKRRGEGAADKHLSVTVSIGACSPSKRLRTPRKVIKAADEALYRAKQGGRNRRRWRNAKQKWARRIPSEREAGRGATRGEALQSGNGRPSLVVPEHEVERPRCARRAPAGRTSTRSRTPCTCASTSAPRRCPST